MAGAETSVVALKHVLRSGILCKWWSADTVAVVTGSNKGIVYELARQLATNGLTTVMTARDEGRGSKAAEALRSEVKSDRIAFHPLDVCSEESATVFSKWLKHTYGGADILIHNAGVAFGENEKLENSITTMQTNYYGVENVTKAVLPVLPPSPAGTRIIVVSSRAGQLSLLSNHYCQDFASREQITEEEVDEFVESYMEELKTGKGIGGWLGNRWPPSYRVSKMAANAYMANEMRSRPEDEKVYVKCFTPGFTITDMSGHKRVNTVSQGAMTGIWLALHPPQGYLEGKFWSDKCLGVISF